MNSSVSSSSKSPRTIMAFDFGMKRIGIAVGQEHTKTSSPLDPISAKDGIPNWEELEKLVNQWSPRYICGRSTA